MNFEEVGFAGQYDVGGLLILSTASRCCCCWV